MGLGADLPFVVGLYVLLLIRWMKRFAISPAAATQALTGLEQVELAFLCGGARRASATTVGKMQLSGEAPSPRAIGIALTRVQEQLIDAGLLQRAELSWMVHFVFAMLPVVGLVAFPGLAWDSAGATRLCITAAVGVGSLAERFREGRGAGWELSPLGHQVSVGFRARHRALGFVESRFPTFPLGPTVPPLAIVCALLVALGPLRCTELVPPSASSTPKARKHQPRVRLQPQELLELEDWLALDDLNVGW